MLTVVYVAQDLPAAERLKGVLEEEGIMATLRLVGAGKHRKYYEILVSELEAEEAQDILCRSMGS
ncbi:MAG: glutamate decarboxylase [Firmicutes bacterium]|nr:glutamate decarboxylase [Bacillota bacterium]